MNLIKRVLVLNLLLSVIAQAQSYQIPNNRDFFSNRNSDGSPLRLIGPAPDGSGNVLIDPDSHGIQAAHLNNVRNCSSFPGVNAASRILACLSDLGSTGGVADATGFLGVQTIDQAIVISAPIRLHLASARFTFTGSGSITATSCGASIEGSGNGTTTFSPDPSYTGTFVTVRAGSCLNGFGYQYGVRLASFRILDGNDAFDGSGRRASADGILLRDTDDIYLEDVQVRYLKGTSLRMRNVRESEFHSFYSFMGGDPSDSKPAVWIGNAASETVIDDSNDNSFYTTRIVYPNYIGLLVDTGNATSITTAQVARGLIFHDTQVEGQVKDNSNNAISPPNYDLVQLGHCNAVKFFGGFIGNSLYTNTAVTALNVGSTSYQIRDTVELYGVDLFGPLPPQSYSTCNPSCGTNIKVDHINTFELHGGRVMSSDPHWGTINITANSGRVYIDPLTRVEQRSDPLDSNGAGIIGTLTALTGLYPPVDCVLNTACTGQEVIKLASQALQVPNWVGDPTSGSHNLSVASNGGASIVTTDVAGTGYLAIRSRHGMGGGTVAVDSDPFQILRMTTRTECFSSASPAVCGSAPSGFVAIAPGSTSVVVETTAVKASSTIQYAEDSTIGSQLAPSVICNTTTGRVYSTSARTAGTSFTITTSAAPSTNPACIAYWIVN
jgi:hypothetical protein